MNKKIINIVSLFDLEGKISNIEENNQGNINSTFIITMKQGKKEKKYLLQNSTTQNSLLMIKNSSNRRKVLSKYGCYC